MYEIYQTNKDINNTQNSLTEDNIGDILQKVSLNSFYFWRFRQFINEMLGSEQLQNDTRDRSETILITREKMLMKSVQQNLITMLKEHSARKYLAAVVCLVAAITVVAVFWALRISGLTLAEDSGSATVTDASAGETATATDANDEESELTTDSAAVSAYGVSLASDDEKEESTTASTVATTSTDFSDYYLAATVDGVPSSGTYIIYTYDEDNETYYVINSDGELEVCEVISSVEEATGEGAYYIESTGTVVYGSAGASAYSSALWTVTQDSGDGNAYTISHAESDSTCYIAPAGETEDVTIGEKAFSGNTGTVTISGDFTLTYMFYNKSNGTDYWDNFILEMVSGGVYLDVRADNYAWIGVGTDVTANENDTVTVGDGSDDWTAWNTAMANGQLCTVKIVKSGTSVTVTTTANEETFTATANVEEYGDDAEISIYLTGQNCAISDVLYIYSCNSDSDTGSNLTSSATDLVSDALGYVTFTRKASGGVTMDRGDITAVVTTDSTSAATAFWKAYGAASTFYFAAVQTTADDYHFADTVTLLNAAENQGDSYITYTKIGDDYYLVSAVDGSLLKCIDISSYSEDQKILLSAGTGAYVWEYVTDEDTEETVPSFKFTSGTGNTDSFANYYWTVSGSINDETSGAGSYTIANSAKSDYLAPGVDGTEVKLARYDTVSKVATLDSYGTSVFSITVDGYNGGSGTYYTHLQTIVYNSSETIVARLRWNAYATTNSGTAENGWNWSIDRGTGYSLGEFTNIQLGDVITLTVTAASDGLYLNYYNNRSAETYICYFPGLDLSAGYYVNFYTQNGSYTIHSELVETTEAASGDTVEANSDAETTGVYTQVTSDTLSSYDFDLTCSFTNTSTSSSSSLEDNFSIRLDNGLDTSAEDYTCIDVSFNSQTVTDSSGDTFYKYGFDSTDDDAVAALQAIMGSGASCSVRVIRTGCNFFFILSASDNSATTYKMYVSVTVSAFDGCEANVYLMGQNCTISDITLEGSIYNVADYNRVSANSDALTLSAVDSSGNVLTTNSYLWSATASGTFDETLCLIAQLATDTANTAEIEWVENALAKAVATGTATTTLAGASVTSLSDTVVLTFSFARVTDCFVWFDGTNGGMSSYSAGSSADVYDKITMIPYDASGNLESITTPAVSDVKDASGYGTTTNASYTLRGWYDIYNGKYYTPGATVSLTSSTVMYADWAVESYDIGESNDNTVETVSTNKFITTRLFDYNDDYDKIALN